MRSIHALLALFFVTAAAGCGTHAPTAPVAPTAPEAQLGDTFVLGSPDDPRLPASESDVELDATDRSILRRSSRLKQGRAASGEASAPVFWNQLTRDLASGASLPPPRFGRAYALVHVGLHDALSLSGHPRWGRLPEHTVMAGVALEVLTYLFPNASSQIESAVAAQVALDGDARGRVLAWILGRVVGRLVVARGRADGSDAVFTDPIPTGDCYWMGSNPVLPLAGSWRTWVIDSGDAIQPEPPYACGSAEDLADVQEVLDVSLNRTPEQIALAIYWATGSPPSIWNRMLNERIEAQGLGTVAAARAQAYLNVSMADAFICCWQSKYTYWTARPFHRIPELVTVVPTPNFPGYTSGHSTISASAAEVMAEVFPAEADYFRAQALDAAMSRLYGGIHFRHDNEQGTEVGTEIGERVVERMKSRRLLVAGL